MGEEIIVLVTASSEEEASRIAKTLVDEHLVACVNVLPGLRSFFHWDGMMQDERELLLIGKSTKTRMPEIIARVKALHSYTVPEIIALPIVEGSQDYLQWMKETVKK